MGTDNTVDILIGDLALLASRIIDIIMPLGWKRIEMPDTAHLQQHVARQKVKSSYPAMPLVVIRRCHALFVTQLFCLQTLRSQSLGLTIEA